MTLNTTRKRNTMFTKPISVAKIPKTKRSKKWLWYDSNYYCSKCDKFYNKKLMLHPKDNGLFYCGVCRDMRYKVRQNPRKKFDSYIASKARY